MNMISKTVILTLILASLASTVFSQDDKTRRTRRFQLVIFSSESDNSFRYAAQLIAWKGFVAELQRKKADLVVVNETAMDKGTDQTRVLQLANSESNRYTIWIRFSVLEDTAKDSTKNQDGERITAEFTVYSPGSGNIVGSGQLDQEALKKSTTETNNTRAPGFGRRLPNDRARNGANMTEIEATSDVKRTEADALRELGMRVATQVIGVIDKSSKSSP